MNPVKIKVTKEKNLYIKWDDNSESLIELKKLRKLCPCATCITRRERQNKTYIPIFNENQVKIKDIVQIGSYAIGITWRDGHNTGIYEFTFLKRLSDGVNG